MEIIPEITSPESEKANILEKIISGINVGGLEKREEGLFVSENLGNSDFQDWSSGAIEFDFEEQQVSIEDRELLQQSLEGKPLVDLGAGITSYVYNAARKMNASGYVGVEPYNQLQLLKELREVSVGGSDRTPALVVAEDMLAFLKRIPDSSVNVTAFSIDNLVLSPRKVGEDYFDLVSAEIIRVLHPDGVFITRGSNFNVKPLTERHLAIKSGMRTTYYTLYKKS